MTNFQTEQMYKHKLVDFVIHVSLLCATAVTVVVLGYVLVCKCAGLSGIPLCARVSVFVQLELFACSGVHAVPGCALHSYTRCV